MNGVVLLRAKQELVRALKCRWSACLRTRMEVLVLDEDEMLLDWDTRVRSGFALRPNGPR